MAEVPQNALVVPVGSLINELMRTVKSLRTITVQFGAAPHNQLVIDSQGNRAFLNIGPAGWSPSTEGGSGAGLPDQAGNAGKFLGTDGTTASWQTVSGGAGYRELTHSITMAGLVPTGTEISTALAATYTDPDPDLVPADGDFVILTISSSSRFVARITTHSIVAVGLLTRSFVVNSVTYYATLHQTGLF